MQIKKAISAIFDQNRCDSQLLS